jgi:S1-C subfamily serine protease
MPRLSDRSSLCMLAKLARSVLPPLALLAVTGCAPMAHPELPPQPSGKESHSEAQLQASAGARPAAAPPRHELSIPELAALAGASVVVVKTEQGFGSGFVVAKNLIATNLHVITGQSSIVVGTPDGTPRQVRGVAAISTAWDLAVLYVPGLGLPALQLGDSGRVQVGEPVLAVGNPEGLSLTVSNGIISKKHGKDGTNVLQTTAPISPGSSGGPLVDAKGAVIGIVTLFYREGQALNFAVASSKLSELLDSMDGHYLGLEQFAAATLSKPAAEASPAVTSVRPADVPVFPAAVAGFAFGLDLERLKRLCPELVVDTASIAACPYLGVELDFATGPARFTLAEGRLVAIALSPRRSDDVLQALNTKYGEPIALSYREDAWVSARNWTPGSPGGLQWNTAQGFVRYGSDDGASPFLVFVSNARRAIQLSNY